MVAKQLEQQMSDFKSWEEMSELEQLACEFSDFYKEAHGFRPRHVDTTSWTVEQFHSEFEELARVCKQNAEFRKEAEAAAAVRFEARIADLIASGAGDRATAIRWVAEAEEVHGDMDYLCFLLGLDYGYFRQAA
jgi:phage-related minor tail protein